MCGANKASGVGVWRAKRAAGGWAAGRPRIVAEGDVLRVLYTSKAVEKRGLRSVGERLRMCILEMLRL